MEGLECSYRHRLYFIVILETDVSLDSIHGHSKCQRCIVFQTYHNLWKPLYCTLRPKVWLFVWCYPLISSVGLIPLLQRVSYISLILNFYLPFHPPLSHLIYPDLFILMVHILVTFVPEFLMIQEQNIIIYDLIFILCDILTTKYIVNQQKIWIKNWDSRLSLVYFDFKYNITFWYLPART